MSRRAASTHVILKTLYGCISTVFLKGLCSSLPHQVPPTPPMWLHISVICLPFGLWNGHLWEELYKLNVNIHTLIVTAAISQKSTVKMCTFSPVWGEGWFFPLGSVGFGLAVSLLPPKFRKRGGESNFGAGAGRTPGPSFPGYGGLCSIRGTQRNEEIKAGGFKKQVVAFCERGTFLKTSCNSKFT